MSVNSKMTAIADAIRSLLGITGTMGLDAMATNLSGIAKRTASNLSASGKTVTVPAGYYPSQVTKDVGTATQATPAISVDSAGKITASATQSAGYVAAGTKSATKQLTTQAAKTITPGTSGQTAIAAGVYATGAVTVAGDANLVPANIVEGKSIFGKTGTAEPASALADELTAQDSLIAQIIAALEAKLPKTISFTIAGTTYQAEEGMTWAEWCDSEYNTGGFWVLSDGYNDVILNQSYMAVRTATDYIYQTSSTVIVAGGSYSLVSYTPV